MDPNINFQGFPPPESSDNYHSFGSNPPLGQDSTPRFRAQGHYQSPYPTSNPRMRQRGEFQQRGRYPHNKRGGGGGYRPQNRNKNYDQQQEQSLDNNEYQTMTTNPSNRHFNNYFRGNMLEDPWANMKPQKVPSDGTSLVSNATTY